MKVIVQVTLSDWRQIEVDVPSDIDNYDLRQKIIAEAKKQYGEFDEVVINGMVRIEEAMETTRGLST